MSVGMTGTREGMTQEQKDMFLELLEGSKATELHHGDCAGADADAHDISVILQLKIVIHPPTKTDLRAFKDLDNLIDNVPLEVKEPYSYFARNRHIVDDTEILIATPVTDFETKGGTWYTINYGIKQGKPVHIIFPDGSIKSRNI